MKNYENNQINLKLEYHAKISCHIQSLISCSSGINCWLLGNCPEAEFLDVIGEKSFLNFPDFTSPLSHSPSKSGLKLLCNVNIVYVNRKSENSYDYAQNPQRNVTFMNLALGQQKQLISWTLSRVEIWESEEK